jgi:hypothetical protein
MRDPKRVQLAMEFTRYLFKNDKNINLFAKTGQVLRNSETAKMKIVINFALNYYLIIFVGTVIGRPHENMGKLA